MSREIPELPAEVRALSADILTELTDVKFGRYTHGRRGTYALGCRGPLCKRQERIDGKAGYIARRIASGKPYKESYPRLPDREFEFLCALETYERHYKIITLHVRLQELWNEVKAEMPTE